MVVVVLNGVHRERQVQHQANAQPDSESYVGVAVQGGQQKAASTASTASEEFFLSPFVSLLHLCQCLAHTHCTLSATKRGLLRSEQLHRK